MRPVLGCGLEVVPLVRRQEAELKMSTFSEEKGLDGLVMKQERLDRDGLGHVESREDGERYVDGRKMLEISQRAEFCLW